MSVIADYTFLVATVCVWYSLTTAHHVYTITACLLQLSRDVQLYLFKHCVHPCCVWELTLSLLDTLFFVSCLLTVSVLALIPWHCHLTYKLCIRLLSLCTPSNNFIIQAILKMMMMMMYASAFQWNSHVICENVRAALWNLHVTEMFYLVVNIVFIHIK